MGKKSTRANKNIYQLIREELGYTRDQASDLLGWMSSDRIEKIESNKSLPHPDEILLMSKCYKKPELCNYYCHHVCEIGKELVPELSMKELSQITLDVISSLNDMHNQRDRFIDIVVDGKISDDEYNDFKKIYNQLQSLSIAIDTLKLWINKNILEGNIKESIRDKK